MPLTTAAPPGSALTTGASLDAALKAAPPRATSPPKPAATSKPPL